MGAVGGTELIQRVKAGRRFYEQIGGEKKKGRKAWSQACWRKGMLHKSGCLKLDHTCTHLHRAEPILPEMLRLEQNQPLPLLTLRSALHQSSFDRSVWLKKTRFSAFMFSSQIPWPIEKACSELISLCFYYSWLGSGFHLPSAAVSQCFLARRHGYSLSDVCACVGSVNERLCGAFVKIGNACRLHGYVRLCACVGGRVKKKFKKTRGFVQERGFFKTHL